MQFEEVQIKSGKKVIIHNITDPTVPEEFALWTVQERLEWVKNQEDLTTEVVVSEESEWMPVSLTIESE